MDLREVITYPEADAETASIPRGAGVLRIALDYTKREAESAPPSVALSAMRSRDIYDEDLLDLFADVAGVGAAPPVREIPVSAGGDDVGRRRPQHPRQLAAGPRAVRHRAPQ
jgi:hypothetical protein